jgi:hypothetical protein
LKSVGALCVFVRRRFHYIPIETGNFKLDGGAMFGVAQNNLEQNQSGRK